MSMPRIEIYYAKLKAVYDELKSLTLENDLSETDTRVKIIDKIFIEVLGWSEKCITREEPVDNGFCDYTLRNEDRICLHIEAKRISRKFILPDRIYRNLKIDGAYLLGHEENKRHVRQLVGYSANLGSDVGVLTNGHQWIILRTFISGRKWSDYNALIFYSIDDIRDHFNEFYSVLSFESVTQGEHYRKLTETGDLNYQTYKPSEFLQDANVDLYRNLYWEKIKSIFDDIFIDQPDNDSLQLKIIKYCYVFNRKINEVDNELKSLLDDSLPVSIKNIGVEDLDENLLGGSKLTELIQERGRPETYILTGGVGSGKTTYLRRFAFVKAEKFIKENCLWFHIDFLGMGSCEQVENLHEHFLQYAFNVLRKDIESNYHSLVPPNGEEMRRLFNAEIQEAKKTRLYKVDEDTPEFNRTINEIVDVLARSARTFVGAIFKRERKIGKTIVIVFDNTDQLGERLQENMFLFAKYISTIYETINVVALREEKYFVAHKKGILDAFGERSFHIGSPNLNSILTKRFQYGLNILREMANQEQKTSARVEYEQIYIYIEGICRSITRDNHNIMRLIESLTGGNTRFALKLFKDFLSSGNTNIDKILLRIQDGGYTLPFHEFAKSIILGHKKYYSPLDSNVMNIFSLAQAPGARRMTKLLVLKYLYDHRHNESRWGAGYVPANEVTTIFGQCYNDYADINHSLEQLSLYGLIEVEPPKEKRISSMEALRLSASGLYYHKYLSRAFAYLDLIWIDTAFVSMEKARRLARIAGSIDFKDRFERVRIFLLDLLEEERAIESLAKLKNAPIRIGVINDIIGQVDTEMREIAQKNQYTYDIEWK
jgi:hypothetical protein